MVKPTKNSVKLYINGVPIIVPANTTIMQACEKLGIMIPRFCYHDLLGVAGNCRMCLVEIEKSPKPQASCSLPVIDQMRVYTNTPLVKKAQESVLEFLLLNHPLDCPICDQGGECDLQNHALNYSNLNSRFYKIKRGVEDKNLGPIVKTVITRCIHCTRCIRFASEIAGVEDLGTTLRGDHTEVGTYIAKTFESELSGNVIDLCPVGALTSKTHAFQVRPWELKSVQSIDTSDCLGSNISIETKGKTPYKIVPLPNPEINQEWLSDKARCLYEGQSSGRLAFAHFLKNDRYYQFSTEKLKTHCLQNFVKDYHSLKVVYGKNLDINAIQQGVNLSRSLGGDNESETCFNANTTIPAYFQSSISLNSLSEIDSCLLIGVNPRQEATIFNVRLRNRFRACNLKVKSLGCFVDLTYSIVSLGLQIVHLYNLVCGQTKENLNQTRKPLFVYGDTVSGRHDFFSTLCLSFKLNKQNEQSDWLGYARLPLGSNSIGKAFYGLSQQSLKNYQEESQKTTYFLGLENLDINKNLEKKDQKCIVETTHVGSANIKASLILPQISVFEKNGYFINYSGLYQKAARIARFGQHPLSNLKKLAGLKNFGARSKSIVYYFNSFVSKSLILFESFLINLKIYRTPLKMLIDDPYCFDRCTRASLSLNKVSGNFRKNFSNFFNLVVGREILWIIPVFSVKPSCKSLTTFKPNVLKEFSVNNLEKSCFDYDSTKDKLNYKGGDNTPPLLVINDDKVVHLLWNTNQIAALLKDSSVWAWCTDDMSFLFNEGHSLCIELQAWLKYFFFCSKFFKESITISAMDLKRINGAKSPLEYANTAYALALHRVLVNLSTFINKLAEQSIYSATNSELAETEWVQASLELSNRIRVYCQSLSKIIT